MEGLERYRYSIACGKLCYPLAGDALAAKQRILRQPGRPRALQIYWCPKCQAWHLSKGRRP